MAPIETEYYDLLGVPTDVEDVELKKAYRKQAMKARRNIQSDAEEKFKEISVAYQVLSDSNLRAVYDKNGKAMTDKEGAHTMEDAAGFFANVFGGERFMDYIGEISIMKDMTSTATAMMTEEEKTEIERQMNEGRDGAAATPTVAGAPAAPADVHVSPAQPSSPLKESQTPLPNSNPPSVTSSSNVAASSVPTSPSAPAGAAIPSSSTSKDPAKDAADAKEKDRKRKLTAEQREALQKQEQERRKRMQERVETLTKKLIERLRPFVEAKKPGEKDDAETLAFEAKMRREVEDLKLESFGIEVSSMSIVMSEYPGAFGQDRAKLRPLELLWIVPRLVLRFGILVYADYRTVLILVTPVRTGRVADVPQHTPASIRRPFLHGVPQILDLHIDVQLLHTIGHVYMMKATSFLKSRKFLGIPGFFSRLKEKGTLAKDVWGVIGSALSVRDVMLEMEKLQAKGEVAEEELRALEMDMTGKIMLASWRGARLEVIQVLREVVDKVLKEPGVSDVVLVNRARGLLFIGAIFKAAVPDESDAERRELERQVALLLPFILFSFSLSVPSRMVAEAAQPKSKHHQSKLAALRAKREEAERLAKEKGTAAPGTSPTAAPSTPPTETPATPA
ncbi:hypothetical protein CCMSSC00406_0010195 [Pleurotus cornucopiae]|uniref:Uncharacterized protein n=1 Tax=Pleurotus cornucopiae TaxID=5321 RepID=A0ACB7J0I4_PLECO|nr:hypothetical protein CCMSSC00406_0010195 [Pleurotus cornucopiae]